MSFEVVDYDVELYKDGCWHIQIYPQKSKSYDEAEARCDFIWRALRWPCRVVKRRWLCGTLTETVFLNLPGRESTMRINWLREGF